MPRERVQPAEEPTGGVPAWMVTFSDCMTLLLTFFVLLLTFSSFEDVARQQFTGICRSITFTSIFPFRREIRDSLIEPIEKPVDRAMEGSDKPTEERLDSVDMPRRSLEIADTDAYRDRKVIYIPSSALFWGSGGALKPSGCEKLDRIASFMRQAPSRVIVSESRLEEGLARAAGPGDVLTRPLAVVNYLTRSGGVPAEWFSIASTDSQGARRRGGRPALQITLLARGMYQ